MAVLSLLLLTLATAFGTAPKAAHARLYCGTDESGFSGVNGQLAVAYTNGPRAGAMTTFNLSYPLNDLTSATGYMLAGQPENVGSSTPDTLRTLEGVAVIP